MWRSIVLCPSRTGTWTSSRSTRRRRVGASAAPCCARSTRGRTQTGRRSCSSPTSRQIFRFTIDTATRWFASGRRGPIRSGGVYGAILAPEERAVHRGVDPVSTRVRVAEGDACMIAATLPKIEGSVVTSIPLEARGPFGPPLGEPLDGPMPTAGLRLWTSGDGTIRTGLWECGPGRFRTTYDDEGELIWLVAGTLTCVED